MGNGYFGSKKHSQDIWAYGGGYKIGDRIAKDLGWFVWIHHWLYTRTKMILLRIYIRTIRDIFT